MFKDILILTFFILCHTTCIVYGQNDTIYIDEKPLVIKQNVYVTKELPKIRKYYTISYTALVGYSINRDYYGVCNNPYCYDYYTQVRSSTKPQYNSIYSFGIGYIDNKFALETTIYYSLYRDKFNYTDINRNTLSNINKYHTIDLTVQPGYFYSRKKSKTYFLIQIGPSLSYLSNAAGLMYSKTSPSEIEALDKEIKFNKINYRLGIEITLGEKRYNTLSLKTSLFYTYDLRSFINKSEFYTRQRNIFGLKVGFAYLKNKLYK